MAPSKRFSIDLSQGSWGWDRGGRFWVPPEFAGITVSPRLFAKWTPNPVNMRPFASDARGLNLCASRRGGKTYFAGRVCTRRYVRDHQWMVQGRHPRATRREFQEWFAEVVGRPGERPHELFSQELQKRHAPLTYWAVAPDRALAKLQARELSDIWLQPEVRDAYGARWFGDTLWILRLGIKVELKTGENPLKLVGEKLAGVWLGEAARLKPEVWENLSPALNDSRGWWVSDTTPKGRNWYFNELWARGDMRVAQTIGNEWIYDKDVENYHWTAADNVALPHLAVEMERARKRYGEKSRHYIENYAATFDQPEGMVWPELSDSVHFVFRDEQQMVARFGALDWGFTGSAGVLGFLGAFRDSSLNWYRGHYHHGLLDAPAKARSDAEVAASDTWAGFILREYSRLNTKFPVYADASRPESIRRLRNLGILIRPADNRPGSILDSCTTVEALLVYDPDSDDPYSRRPMMTFSPALPSECKQDLFGYVWATDSTGKSVGIPSKNPDRHFADVVRYGTQAIIKGIRLSRIAQFTLRR